MTGPFRGRLTDALVGAVLGLLAVLLAATPAGADPAGPTDYLSEVVGVDPPTATIEVAVIGGDSFVQLQVAPGTEVMVLGYQGEDYLWFQPDGTVLENRNSPSTYLNEERYGSDVPPNASADAEPDWTQVGSSGTWSWHDHRAHWMQRIDPPGLGPGDQILEAVIPLRVDDEEVDVTVISTWQSAPSRVPVAVGGVLGLGAAGAAWALRRTRWSGLMALPVSAVALVVGVWQFTSLPSETGPRLLWWLLPALAVIASGVAAVAGWRRSTFVAWSATLIAGVELAIWGWVKSDGLWASIVPTDAPGWLDRLATAAALVGGVGLAVVAVVQLFALSRGVSGSREPSDSPLPAHP